MGFLVQILLAAGALSMAEAGLGSGGWPAELGILLLPLPHLVSLAARRAGEAGRFRRAARWIRLGSLLPPLAYAALVLQTDWLARVRSWTGAGLDLDGWPELALGLAFAPYVLYQLSGIHADARAHDPRPDIRKRVLRFQVRMFLSALMPLVLYLVLTVGVGLVPGWRAHVENVGLFHALFIAGLMVVLGLSLPMLLANTWETYRLPDGPQRVVLDAVAQRARFRPREVRVWRTGNLMANAAILGMGDRYRVVLFSDSLLSILGPGELAAVYAHEIGHAKRRHVAVFVAWALAFLLLGDLASQELAPGNPWASGAILAGFMGAWALGFGWLSRRCELEADLYGVELLGDPGSMASALERVGGRLRDVAGWRHFSTRDRIEFLWRAWREPRFAGRFRTRLRRLAWLGSCLCILGVGLQARTLLRSLPGELVLAEIAQGRWDRALERTVRLEDSDEQWRELVELGAARQGELESLGERELIEALEVELSTLVDLQRSYETSLLLAVLSPQLEPVARALGSAVDGDEASLQAALEDCPPRWSALLARRLEQP